MDVSPEELQFQEQLEWCISKLEHRLATKYLSQREAEQSLKCLNTLKNQSSSYVRKRKAMRQALGDYRKTMAEEAKKGVSKDVQPLKTSLVPYPSQMDLLPGPPLSGEAKEKIEFDPKLKEWEKRKEFLANVHYNKNPKTSKDVADDKKLLPDPALHSLPVKNSVLSRMRWRNCRGAEADYGTTESEDVAQPLEDDDDVAESAYRRDMEELYDQSCYMKRIGALRSRVEEFRVQASKQIQGEASKEVPKCSDEDDCFSDNELEELTKKFSNWRWKGGNLD